MEKVRLEGVITKRIKSKGIVYVKIDGRESEQAIRIKTDSVLYKKIIGWR